jgi:hypothetical protein
MGMSSVVPANRVGHGEQQASTNAHRQCTPFNIV